MREVENVEEAVRVQAVVLSLGGGVQSTSLALMAADGLFPAPDVALFADTGNEPQQVYDTIRELESRVPFPVVTVGSGSDIAQDTIDGVNADGRRKKNGDPFLTIPVHLLHPDGKTGMSQRQCTSQYKIRPIVRGIKEFLGYDPLKRVPYGTVVEQWLGISTDEWMRAKPNRVQWIRNKFPLLDADISRQDCQDYLDAEHPDLRVGKSACVICPYHDSETWRWMEEHDPKKFAHACEVDRSLRETPSHDAVAFLHPARVPLREAVKVSVGSLDGEECEGMCFI